MITTLIIIGLLASLSGLAHEYARKKGIGK